MYTIEELNIEGIRQWDSIKKDFTSSSILLGNGFSLNFSDTLRYKYLYENFVKDCSEISKDLFSTLDTRNFEKVLESLEIAELICKTLKISNELFEEFRNEIRQGLIDSINKIHPKAISIDQELITKISKQFIEFNQIFTTNYDLFLYYIILETKKFGDYFFGHHSEDFNIYTKVDQMRLNHIYYLHGALFLFEDGLTTLKIKKPSEGWLLDAITKEISNNRYPLFISEGKSNTKLKSIQSNSYLSYCLSRFEHNSDRNLIIYGQSLSKQDYHLVSLIDKCYEKIAISIRVEDWPTKGSLIAEKNRLSSLFNKAKYELYDSKTLFTFN